MTPFAAWRPAGAGVHRGGVVVYGGSVEAAFPFLERMEGILSEDEKARAARFAFERDRRAYVAAHGMLREILGARLHVAPEALRFGQRDGAKPVLDRPPSDLGFNLSHAGDAVAIAIGHGIHVGVDVEVVDPGIERAVLAKRFFTPEEAVAVASRPVPERVPAFFRCWTRKEAIVKAAGGGLSIKLSSFQVDVDAAYQTVHLGAERWWLRDLDPGDGYEGAVAASADAATVAVRWSPSV